MLWSKMEYTTRCCVAQDLAGRNVDMFLEGLLLLVF